MTRLAIIHTTPATLEPLKALAAELLPDCDVINFMDDSILPQLGKNGGNLSEVEDRLIHYVQFAEQAKADVILSACSSVGEVVAKAQQFVSIPIIRIDEAMAVAAIQRASAAPVPSIGVVATLATTLNPTLRLLQATAGAMGKEIKFSSRLVEAAYQRLMAGDKEGHDAALVEALSDLARSVEVVVLAQASMARVLPRLPKAEQGKILSSPCLGMEQVKRVLNKES
jgi:aspartate/glutamate racemase